MQPCAEPLYRPAPAGAAAGCRRLAHSHPLPPLRCQAGERVIAASRRPDGTVRKERRVRAGYVPQDEQQVYVSRGAAVSACCGAVLAAAFWAWMLRSTWQVLLSPAALLDEDAQVLPHIHACWHASTAGRPLPC